MTRQPVLPVKEHFLIVEDDKGRKEVLLTEDSYSLGRGKNCDIVLHSQFVSRYHATIFRFAREDGQGFYRIVDGDREGRASANGLLVNGKKVSSAELKDGDEVVFGPQVFAIYKCRQRDKFPTIPTNDPFDITLIDPAMMVNDDES
jgi:pSer/pThr/pTyr-binding forkhead associated (FHA) protein